MAYTAPQIGVILLKADRTMYKIGQIAYENMFAEDNEALDYERDVIFIYKKAVEFADDFFVGTEKLDKVVERLATKISAYDYGELNPIYADAATVNIPSVVAGAALNDLTDVTIANLLDNQLLRYNAATGQWINVGPGSAVRSSQAFIATAGQSVFTTSAPFDAGLFDLYVNGVKLNSLSYTTMGEYQITLNDPCSAGDIVDVVIYDPNTGINPTANTLNDLTDVNIGPLANKQGLYYNSASGLWENGLVFVPYTGATAAVDLGEFEIRAGQFTLDTSPTGTATVGTTRWNDSIGSSETTLKGGSVILKNGVDLVARVVNKVTPNTTLTKASYAAVRISGAQGQRLAVAYAQANNDANSADTIGLVTETIATNQEGFIMTMGNLEGINTTGSLQGETWADGDVLYLSPTVPGGITNVKPTGLTGHIVVVGYVEYAHANNGKIYVKTMNGWELDELHNVNINTGTLANGDVLKYNATTQLWENGVDAGGITGTGVAGQVPYFTGASAVSGSTDFLWDNTSKALTIQNTNSSSFSDIALASNGGVNVRGLHLYAFGSTYSGVGAFSPSYVALSTGSSVTRLAYVAFGSTAWYTGGSTAANERMQLTSTGNLLIGFTTDQAVKLAVNGDTLLRGSGATSATTALTVQNSSSTNLLTVLNDGKVGIGTNAPEVGKIIDVVFNEPTFGGRGVRIRNTNPTGFSELIFDNDRTPTGSGAFVFGLGGQSSSAAADTAYFFLRLNSSLLFGTNNTERARFHGNGNFSINSTSDLGVKFGVVGDTLLRGSGNTSATTALTVQNSDSTNLFRVRNDGSSVFINNTGNNFTRGDAAIVIQRVGGSPEVGIGITADNILRFKGETAGFNFLSGTSQLLIAGNRIYAFNNSGTVINSNITNTTSFNDGSLIVGNTVNYVNIAHIYSAQTINPTITGLAGGVARGLYVNPTLTAAADFRAIETTTGNVLFGSNFFWDNTNSRLGIGTNAPSALIDVRSSSNAATGIDVRNSSSGNAARCLVRLFNDNGNLGQLSIFGSGTTQANKVFFESTKDFVIGTDAAVASGGTSKFQIYVGGYNAATSPQLSFHATANLSIGSTADNGQRLQVYGDTLLRGSGATSATTALTVQNSSSTDLLRVRNDGNTIVGTGTPTSFYLRGMAVSGTTGDISLGVFNSSTTGTAGFILGQSNSAFASFFKWGSAYVGNFAGSSIPFANASQFQSGTNNDLTLIFQGTPIVFNCGLTGTNIAARISTGSYRITTLSNAHTDGTALLDLDASTTTRASLRIRSGTAPTSPNDGDIWFDGTDIKMRIGGVTKTFTLI